MRGSAATDELSSAETRAATVDLAALKSLAWALAAALTRASTICRRKRCTSTSAESAAGSEACAVNSYGLSARYLTVTERNGPAAPAGIFMRNTKSLLWPYCSAPMDATPPHEVKL